MVLVGHPGDDSWFMCYVQLADIMYGTGICHDAIIQHLF